MKKKLPKLHSCAEAEEFVANADLTEYDIGVPAGPLRIPAQERAREYALAKAAARRREGVSKQG